MNGSFNGKRLFNDRLGHKSWISEKKEKLNAPSHSINKWGDQDKSAIFSSPITQKPRMIIRLHKVQKLLIIDFWWGLGWGGEVVLHLRFSCYKLQIKFTNLDHVIK